MRNLMSVLMVSVVATAGVSAAAVSDFALDDHNGDSPRFEEMVSPRNYGQQVSGYYFGAAT